MRAAPVEEDRKERFEALYLQHYPSIYAYVHRRLAETGAEVRDVVADVFAVAWTRFDVVPDAPEDRLWLYGVARRCVAHARRSGWRRQRLQFRLSDQARANGQADDASVVLVQAAIERLPAADREVVRLVMWEGLTHAEAGRVLGCSANAVAVRLHKARKRLQAALADGDPATPTVDVDLEPRS